MELLVCAATLFELTAFEMETATHEALEREGRASEGKTGFLVTGVGIPAARATLMEFCAATKPQAILTSASREPILKVASRLVTSFSASLRSMEMWGLNCLKPPFSEPFGDALCGNSLRQAVSSRPRPALGRRCLPCKGLYR